MRKFRKPFFRENRCLWYVWHQGRQVNLGPTEKDAFKKWHDLTGSRPAAPETGSVTVVEILDHFLDWSEKNNDRGPAIMIFPSDGQSFVGFWWRGTAKGAPSGMWSGNRIAAEPGACAHWKPEVWRNVHRGDG